MKKPLLPPGCYDLLPPRARQETHVAARLLDTFERFGYAQVSPPLLEYTESLLAGRGAALGAQTFRVMDPAAHKVMGLRADMTLQVARIAVHRLADEPRPLRLCYAGPILHMTPQKLRSERQLAQAGVEMFGADAPEADAEVIAVAVEALHALGLAPLTVDLNLPGLVGLLLAEETLTNEEAAAILEAVSHKDAARLAQMDFASGGLLIALLEASGPTRAALQALEMLALPPAAAQQLARFARVAALLEEARLPQVTLTVDITENRGFEYYSGLCFSLFAQGASVELGRGGRYRVDASGAGMEATGFTLYVDSLRDIAPPPPAQKRVYLPKGMAEPMAGALREQGWVTVYGLPGAGDAKAEAKRLGCTHVLEKDKPSPVN